MPTAGAIGRARLRLGPEPLKALFARVCRPVADRTRSAPGTGSGGWARWTAPVWRCPAPHTRSG
ncbi:hypothetical protein [Streptomyces sp. NPDC001415]